MASRSNLISKAKRLCFDFAITALHAGPFDPSTINALGENAAAMYARPAQLRQKFKLVRIVLQVIFNGQGRIERELSVAAAELVACFERLCRRIRDAPTFRASSSSSSGGADVPASPLREGLVSFRTAMDAHMQASAGASLLPTLVESFASVSVAGSAVVMAAGPPPPAALRSGSALAVSGGIARPAALQPLLVPSPAGEPPAAAQPGTPPRDQRANNNSSQQHHSQRMAALLVAFDDAWVSYLELFVAWKTHDVRNLEKELVGVAVRLETSMLRKTAGRAGAARLAASEDLQAVVEQVCVRAWGGVGRCEAGCVSSVSAFALSVIALLRCRLRLKVQYL